MSNSSEFSFNSEVDVDEGTVAASVHVSVQENSIKQSESEPAGESHAENSVCSIKEIEVSSSSKVLNHSSDYVVPEVQESPSVPISCKEHADNEIQQEDGNSKDILKDHSLSDNLKTQSDYIQTEGNQSPQKNEVLITETPSIFQRLTHKIKKSSRKSLYQRLNNFHERSQEKIMKATQEQIANEMNKCTFTPTINHSKQPKRSLEEFLSFQEQHLANRNEKIKILKKRQSEVNDSFQPSLCENSFKILQERKLSEPSVKVNKSPETPETTFSFKPKINNRDRLRKRTKPIHEHLYESPKKQSSFDQSSSVHSKDTSQTNKHSSVRHTNKFSEIAIHKFKEEFSRIYDELADSQGLSYSMYIKLLERMGFIKTEKDLALESWNQLSKGSGFLTKKHLLSFFLSVMNYRKSTKTHFKYLSFYHNRSKKSQVISPPKYSFKPKLTKNTLKIASSPENRLEFLVKERQEHLEKWKRQQMDRDKTELSDLKFKPNTNPRGLRRRSVHKKGSIAHIWEGLRNQDKCSTHRAISLYSLSIAMLAHNKEKEEDAKNDEYHDNMKTCTFSPTVRKHLLFRKKPIGLPKGFTDAVSRVRKVHSQKEIDKNRNAKPFSFTIDRNSKHTDVFKPTSPVTSNARDGTKSFSDFRSAFYMLKYPFRIPEGNYITNAQSESESEDNPIEISVKLPSGNVEQLVIYSEAQKMEAVDAFIKQHELTGEICQQLREGVMDT